MTRRGVSTTDAAKLRDLLRDGDRHLATSIAWVVDQAENMLEEVEDLRAVIERVRLHLSVGARVDGDDFEAIQMGIDMLTKPLLVRAEKAEDAAFNAANVLREILGNTHNGVADGISPSRLEDAILRCEAHR